MAQGGNLLPRACFDLYLALGCHAPAQVTNMLFIVETYLPVVRKAFYERQYYFEIELEHRIIWRHR